MDAPSTVEVPTRAAAEQIMALIMSAEERIAKLEIGQELNRIEIEALQAAVGTSNGISKQPEQDR